MLYMLRKAEGRQPTHHGRHRWNALSYVMQQVCLLHFAEEHEWGTHLFSKT